MFKKILMLSLFLTFPLTLKADFVTGERYVREKNYSAAFNEFLPDANAGDARSQYYVGYLYYYGYGIPQNLDKAVEYLTISAQKNNANAQSLLGYMYDRGEGVPLDKKKAFELYKAAADQQNPSAIFNLGLAYYQGSGVASNIQKAIELLSSIPIDEDNKHVGFYLGNFYLNTEDSDKIEKARDYFSQSAKFGHIDSFFSLAKIFEEVDKNLDKAIEYYTYAASQQYAPAQYVLGTIYINGNGVKRDLPHGYAWMEMASKQNYEPAQQALKDIGPTMILSQSEKAREEFGRIQNDIINKIESPFIVQQRIEEANKPAEEQKIFFIPRGGRRI